MALTVKDANNVEIGNVTPGWSVQEFATPNAPGDTAGGTGTVGYGIGGIEDDLLLIDGENTATDERLGSITGAVQTSSLSGLGASFSQGTYLAKFDAERLVPPNQTGGVVQEILLMMNELGLYDFPDYLPGDALTGYTMPMIGSSFDSTRSVGFETIFPPLPSYPDPYRIEGIPGSDYGIRVTATDTVSVLPVASTGSNIYPEFATSDTTSGVIQMMVDLSDPTADLYMQFAIGSAPFSPMFDNLITMRVRNSTEQITAQSVTGSYAGVIDTSQPVWVTLYFEASPILILGANQIAVRPSVTLTDHTGTTLSVIASPSTEYAISQGGGSGIQPVYYDFAGTFDITLMNIFTRSESGPTLDYSYPTVDVAIPFDTADFTRPTMTEPFIGFLGNCWEHLQMLCSAFGCEVAPTTDSFVLRDIGGRTLSLDNIQGGSALSIGAGSAGRHVEIEYTNASTVSGLVYSAFLEGNQVLSVSFGETVETVLTTDVYPIQLSQPVKTTWVSGLAFDNPGVYTVIDSTGLQIVDAQWRDYGGELIVSLSDEIPNAIVVNLTGPREEIPSTTAPYSIAVSDGANQYAFLNITGVAVDSSVSTLKLATGANEAVITRDVANTIRNPFIVTKEQAFDRGVRASNALGGIAPTINFSIPTSAATGFGVTPGSLVEYRDCIYRITNASVSLMAMTVTAIPHTTVADFDAIWGTRTLEWFDSFWADYALKGVHVFPLRGRSGRVWVALDENGDPYFVYSAQQAGANVYLDEDGIPYYREGDGTRGVTVYLDDDFVPYYV